MQTETLDRLRSRVAAQREKIPEIYGRVDFSIVPERFAGDVGATSVLPGKFAAARAALLADADRVAFIRNYSMMGDPAADAYAALMREHGFRRLVGMLVQACDAGVETVADAPRELVALIRDMERTPAWLDMKLVEQGARIDRNGAANLSPFLIRGAFLATFMNKYAALPMAITNALSSNSSARRVKETATFFATSVLPGALGRFGPGFKAAAMVRLMHSMVRANVMRRADNWDIAVYGIPIPQVDQMPAGLIPIFLLAQKVLSEGRTQFTAEERARVELARYRCFLLGLPEDLLSDTPQGIVDLMVLRSATLRAGYDDKTCGELVRATMAATLRPDESLRSRLFETFERSFAKLFFVNSFLNGDRARAASIGVPITAGDRALTALVGAFLFSRVALYRLASRIPGLRGIADRRLVRRIQNLLKDYGHAEFTTDASAYRPAQPSVAKST
ncbi:oxygenase MpaB family protein [uncultured Bradyrhizobium sp.]|uniref:oxygenase MpaB family protein n=1 Tax=uncultured Bradyrhizobium sp. TaxID=199684 RepID=UPI002614A991|nr:oxygenase MpaB family protein [uncultured Bradyrhizobium sp.]